MCSIASAMPTDIPFENKEDPNVDPTPGSSKILIFRELSPKQLSLKYPRVRCVVGVTLAHRKALKKRKVVLRRIERGQGRASGVAESYSTQVMLGRTE
jgi:hypothetical protein